MEIDEMKIGILRIFAQTLTIITANVQ